MAGDNHVLHVAAGTDEHGAAGDEIHAFLDAPDEADLRAVVIHMHGIKVALEPGGGGGVRADMQPGGVIKVTERRALERGCAAGRHRRAAEGHGDLRRVTRLAAIAVHEGEHGGAKPVAGEVLQPAQRAAILHFRVPVAGDGVARNDRARRVLAAAAGDDEHADGPVVVDDVAGDHGVDERIAQQNAGAVVRDDVVGDHVGGAVVDVDGGAVAHKAAAPDGRAADGLDGRARRVERREVPFGDGVALAGDGEALNERARRRQAEGGGLHIVADAHDERLVDARAQDGGGLVHQHVLAVGARRDVDGAAGGHGVDGLVDDGEGVVTPQVAARAQRCVVVIHIDHVR